MNLTTTNNKFLNTQQKLERCVLGAILTVKGAILEVIGELNPIYFVEPFNAAMCSMFLDMHTEGIDIDIVTAGESITPMLKELNMDVQHSQYKLVDLANNISSAAHIATHMAMLKELYVKRQLAMHLHDKMQVVNEEDPVKVISEIQDYTTKLLEHKQAAFQLSHDEFLEHIIANSESAEKVIRFSGVSRLDDMMQGTTENDFIAVGGIAGSGKSSFINTNLRHLIEQGVGFFFWSGEMTILQTKARLIAALASIPSWKIEKRFTSLSEEDKKKVRHFSKRIYNLEKSKDIVFREGRMSCAQFQGEVLQARFKNPNIRIAFADAMRLFTEVQNAKDEEQEMGKVCRSLRMFCNTHKMRVVMVTQLVKAGRNSADYVPKVSHIRGKGTDQEFTKVILVHRPKLLDMDNGEISNNEARIFIGKNNHGKTGVVEANFDSDRMLFESFEHSITRQEVYEQENVDVSAFQSTTPTFDNSDAPF